MIEAIAVAVWGIIAIWAMLTRRRRLRRLFGVALVMSVTVAVFVHGLTMFDGDVFYSLLLAALPFMFAGALLASLRRLRGMPLVDTQPSDCEK